MIAKILQRWRNRHRHVWNEGSTVEERVVHHYDPNHRYDGSPHQSCYPYVLVKTVVHERCDCGSTRVAGYFQQTETMAGVAFHGPFD